MLNQSKNIISESTSALNFKVQEVLKSLREGNPIILLDNENRENEADLIVAAEKITLKTMAMLIRECSGIVCLCLDDVIIQKLQLPQMVQKNESRYQTAFTVSIDAVDIKGSGVSAEDRMQTILKAIDEKSTPKDLISPGHIFPLYARPGGILERQGHTEGAVELMRLAGLKAAAVLCELMNPDGSMMRGANILSFSQQNKIPIITIDDLFTYLQYL
jgi:3,4-dihydroxy 2-butanone 4-phosphate synthase